MFLLELIESVWDEVMARLRPRRRGASPTRARGDLAEDFALEFLLQQGFTLLARNLGDERGELDLVGRQRGFDGIVVVEVRARREGGLLAPREAVNRRKQRQVVKTARRLLPRHQLHGPLRFDIVGVWLNEQHKPVRAQRFESAFK
ncbi:YraN family protein [bacterium]|nr:MAG: YraN family protein [bacterium]RIK64912.1 MAG: YraN family protein [Planctomycetota bacterium]